MTSVWIVVIIATLGMVVLKTVTLVLLAVTSVCFLEVCPKIQIWS